MSLTAGVTVDEAFAGLEIQKTVNQEYWRAMIVNSELIEVEQMNGGRWERVASLPVARPERSRPIQMSVKRHGEKAVLTVNDRELVRVDVNQDSIFGFCVYDGKATFSHIAIEGMK